ncbi:putative Ig domain-containing protein [Hyalangium rubrum]|uniref:Ig domain-containing protein n=1 Tax=Hyalangium rubrum TaxID=3103134 RepID=A0ABU5H2Z1_9BACT|nr:putative Ig domain-containing protein [Hyalangium sp. s54d21]MDY7227681.1 putative Ig domain-containing protein [Hyalangium sp. s54d21]
MSFVRVTRMLVVLAALCACSGRGNSDGPLLPIIDLPTTTVGLAYEIQLTATGGVPPLRYSVDAVPEGFSFYLGTGLLTGPATSSGEFTLTVGVTDAEGAKDSRTYALRVYAAPTVTTATVPVATVGASYSQRLSASGGQPPLRWSLADGSLPPGVTLSSEGALSGVPRGQGAYPFTVRVQDANGALATRMLSLQLGTGTEPGEDEVFPVQVGNWNIEWFGDPNNGPAGDVLQRDNVRLVISGAGADLWALQEVVDATRFNELKEALPGYTGFMAIDVTNGTNYYSRGEQQLAVLYKTEGVQLLSAEIILGSRNSDFAGRPPLRVDLRITRDGASVDLIAIVLHMKAFGNFADYEQRQRAGAALKQYLDQSLPTARVIVLGDWNDDLDDTTVGGFQPSPYQNFLDASSEYTFLTRELSQSTGSTEQFPSFIDHQLVSNELAASYVDHSTQVLRPNIANYSSTTSDHYPILSRFDFGSPSP